MSEAQEPVVEDPNIVIGGPMGGPADAQVVEASESAAEKPLYSGIGGDFKSVDELKQYTQNLETLLVNKKPEASSPAARSFIPAPNQAPAPVQTKDSFEETIYSDPLKAKEILKHEIRKEMETQRDAERRQERFWQGFYSKNGDLKGMEHIVQSVFSRDHQSIVRLPDDRAVEEHLVREARQIVNEVKKTIGVTETRLQSAPAVAVGSSGSGFVPSAGKEIRPQNFLEQLAGSRAGKGKLKSRGNS